MKEILCGIYCIENMVNSKKYIGYISLGVSMVIGTLFAICFSDLSMVNALWVGIISWIGADAIYKSFEDTRFKPFSKMQEVVEIPKDQIKTLEELGNEVQ